jgi:hypothetical protein
MRNVRGIKQSAETSFVESENVNFDSLEHFVHEGNNCCSKQLHAANWQD